MNPLLIEIGFIMVLLGVNGIFAMTEIAIVSSRRSLLQSMADGGHRGAAKALELTDNPNRFLSTVQIGITLVGIVAGAFGGASIAKRLAAVLETQPFIGDYATQISLAVVIGVITYLQLVLGELVPKRLAMRFPEPIASTMSVPMSWLSTIASPAVVMLSVSTGWLLKIFGVKDEGNNRMSREEFTVMVREGLVMGNIGRAESRMIQGVFEFGELEAYDIMIPRPRMMWIESDATHAEIWPMIVKSTQEVFPVYYEKRDELLGVVSIKDLYAQMAAGAEIKFGELTHPPLMVSETQKASELLESFRSTGQRAAFVIDEFGTVIGMVTVMDLLESIVGDVMSKEERSTMPLRKRPDGSWVINGHYEIEKLPDHIEDFVAPKEAGYDYRTVAGWFAHVLVRMPKEGDTLEQSGWRFEIMDMDGARVDKVMASRVVAELAEKAESA
ncbi:HlyC/CorC family transporter [Phragmitibacter flavus]|uniref:HlyC/CorC family transporter n=1 Tax=Phragmitibacter flavus TaxID=2576071 RepID=A0A5R8KAZ4_9BACT|nr:hemolysin family protein [Phragmitibacter flavus]TLD69471.1 HlyC/CorC family transporter [Phragmitibacter flavus]